MSGPLAGTRVLDLTNVLAGPFCGYQLALLGADVVKVERPVTGDLARQLGADAQLNRRNMGATFLAQNAGKRSLTLDLKPEAGKAVFTRLLATADVVLENFRPGVLARLGFPYERMSAIRPSIVYCAISGFGQDGPLRDNPAYDQIVQGLSGVMGVTGDAASAPLRAGFPVADTVGGLTAAFAIAGALLRVARTGKGEMIDVSMLEATLATMGWQVSDWLICGVRPQPMGNENVTAAPSGTFRTGDGLLNIAANQQAQFEALCAVIGAEALIADPRFEDREDRKRNRRELKGEIETRLSAATAADWSQRLNARGVPAGEVLSLPDALAQPQIAGRGFVRRHDNVAGVGRPVDVVQAGFRMASGDLDARLPPPALGAHTDEILGEIGLTASEITALRQGEVI